MIPRLHGSQRFPFRRQPGREILAILHPYDGMIRQPGIERFSRIHPQQAALWQQTEDKRRARGTVYSPYILTTDRIDLFNG